MKLALLGIFIFRGSHPPSPYLPSLGNRGPLLEYLNSSSSPSFLPFPLLLSSPTIHFPAPISLVFQGSSCKHRWYLLSSLSAFCISSRLPSLSFSLLRQNSLSGSTTVLIPQCRLQLLLVAAPAQVRFPTPSPLTTTTVSASIHPWVSSARIPLSRRISSGPHKSRPRALSFRCSPVKFSCPRFEDLLGDPFIASLYLSFTRLEDLSGDPFIASLHPSFTRLEDIFGDPFIASNPLNARGLPP